MNFTKVLYEELSKMEMVTDPNNYTLQNVNGSNTYPYLHYPEEQIIFLIIVLIAIVLGNSIVLVAVSVAKNRSRMTFFIMHLAIADLLVGFMSLLPDLIWRIVGHFSGGEVLCKIVKFLQCLVTYGSTFVLVSLSIDRLDAIARPLGFSTSKARSRILISIAWMTAAAFAVPTAVLFKTDLCEMNLDSDEHWKIYVTVITFAVFIIPAVIIAFCYGIMVFIIVSKNSSLKHIVTTKYEGKPLYYNKETKHHRAKISDPCHRVQHDCRASSRGIIPQAKIRTIKMTFVIILVFILCWSPYFLWNLLYVYGHIKINQTTIFINIFVQGLAPLNSALNPVIYGVFSTRICRQLRRFRLVELMCDKIPICTDKLDKKIPMTDYRSETSTVMTDMYSARRQNISSPRRSIYSQRESFLVETCDLIASVLPDKK